MNRIEEFLNGLEKKHLVLLYLSIAMLGVVIYFNFNISFMKSEAIKYKKEIAKYKRLKNGGLNKLKLQLLNLTKQEKKLLKKKYKLKEELKRLNTLIMTSPVLFISDNSFANILKEILYNSEKFNVKISLNISNDKDIFKIYTINLNGKANNMYDIYRFIQSIEKIRKIKKVEIANIKDLKDSVAFDLVIKFWSYK
jgi:hypothetical protein